jgi:hypothetical protein
MKEQGVSNSSLFLLGAHGGRFGLSMPGMGAMVEFALSVSTITLY